MSAAPWVKLWWDWYTTRSHVTLSGVALALGGPLMLLCRNSVNALEDRHGVRHGDGHSDADSDGHSDLVWIRDGAGRSINASHLAHISRLPEASIAAAMQELVDCGTLVVSADGTYGFPNFWRYQETASAARTRLYRDREKAKKERHNKRHGDGHGHDKRTEDRGQSLNEDLDSGDLPVSPLPGVVAAVPPANGNEPRKVNLGPPPGEPERRQAEPKTGKGKKPRVRTERDELFDLVVATFEAAHTARHTAPQGLGAQGGLVAHVVNWLVAMPEADRLATLTRAVAGFFADPFWAEQGKHPFHVFAKTPGSFCKSEAPKRNTVQRVSAI